MPDQEIYKPEDEAFAHIKAHTVTLHFDIYLGLMKYC